MGNKGSTRGASFSEAKTVSRTRTHQKQSNSFGGTSSSSTLTPSATAVQSNERINPGKIRTRSHSTNSSSTREISFKTTDTTADTTTHTTTHTTTPTTEITSDTTTTTPTTSITSDTTTTNTTTNTNDVTNPTTTETTAHVLGDIKTIDLIRHSLTRRSDSANGTTTDHPTNSPHSQSSQHSQHSQQPQHSQQSPSPREPQGPVLFATLEWLVVAMTDCSRTDYNIRDMVLLLHPSFCTSFEFAACLILRYNLCSIGRGRNDFKHFVADYCEQHRKKSKRKNKKKTDVVARVVRDSSVGSGNSGNSGVEGDVDEDEGSGGEESNVSSLKGIRRFRSHVLERMGTEGIALMQETQRRERALLAAMVQKQTAPLSIPPTALSSPPLTPSPGSTPFSPTTPSVLVTSFNIPTTPSTLPGSPTPLPTTSFSPDSPTKTPNKTTTLAITPVTSVTSPVTSVTSPVTPVTFHHRSSSNIPGDTPDNQLLRVRLKILSVFSKWIKSDMFRRDVQREHANVLFNTTTTTTATTAATTSTAATTTDQGVPLNVLSLIRIFLLFLNTNETTEAPKEADRTSGRATGRSSSSASKGGSGQTRIVDSLLKHVKDVEQTIERPNQHRSTKDHHTTTTSAKATTKTTTKATEPPSVVLQSFLQPSIVAAFYRNMHVQVSKEAAENPNLYLYQHTPKEIAMNLTIMAFHEITNIPGRDLTGQKFNKGTKLDKKTNSPSVYYVIQHFNDRVRWVCAVLLFNEAGTPGERAATISFWVDVADECVALRNYQTALVIMSAFASPCMNIVSNGMSVIGAVQKMKYDNMKHLMSNEHKYQAYRRQWKEADGKPHVPAFPVLTQDLIRLEEGSKTYHVENNGLISISKFNNIFKKIDTFMNCIKNGYTIVHAGEDGTGGGSGGVGHEKASADNQHRPDSGRSSRGSRSSRSSRSNRLSGSSGSRGSRGSSGGGDGNKTVLVGSSGLLHLFSNWLYPPPSDLELYKTASRVLAEENQNMLETLDYLGL